MLRLLLERYDKGGFGNSWKECFWNGGVDVALMKVWCLGQIAKMARITPAVTLTTLKESSLTPDAVRFNEEKQEGAGFYEEVLKKAQVAGLKCWLDTVSVPRSPTYNTKTCQVGPQFTWQPNIDDPVH